MNCLENKQCFTFCQLNNEEKLKLDSIFQPPKNPEYTIFSESSNEICSLCLFRHSLYNNNSLSLTHYTWITESCYMLKKYNKSSIVILHLKNKNKYNSQGVTILFSHGHNVTLGNLYPFLYDFSSQLRCNIVAYDYSGYGCSEGIATESELKSDITEVYSFIQNKIPNEDIVLFSHSIGSIPSVYLASMAHELLGMILMSPISSGDKLGNSHQSKVDNQDDEILENNVDKPFCILNKLNKISIRTFLIHGTLDNIIHQQHSIEIAKRLVEVDKWYPKNASHYDIITSNRPKFFKKINEFITLVQKYKEIKIVKISNSKSHSSNDIHSEGIHHYIKSKNNEHSVTINDDDSEIK